LPAGACLTAPDNSLTQTPHINPLARSFTGMAGFAQIQLHVSNCSPALQLPDASTDFQKYFCCKKGVRRVLQVDRL